MYIFSRSIAVVCVHISYNVFLSSSAVFTNRLSSAVLTNCLLSVANTELNAVLAYIVSRNQSGSARLVLSPQSAFLPIARQVLTVVANRSSSAVVANCSSSSFIITWVLGDSIHGHMHIR